MEYRHVPRGTGERDVVKALPMSRIIAVANQKGGVGKTTTSVNLAASLAINERSVLLIDMDPQANATSGLGVDTRAFRRSVYDCLVRGAKISEVVKSTAVSKLSIVPSNADLAGAEVELVTVPEREKMLKLAVDEAQGLYDFLIIDCPPALGMLTINALVAASSVLVPVQCDGRVGSLDVQCTKSTGFTQSRLGAGGHPAHPV